ncbi:hypothetical protein [Arthrobacter terrae]|nr:hypothetical protein [Arthrobacter terrae]
MSKAPSPMSWRRGDNIAGRPWRGRVRDYDLFKELVIGVVVVGLLVVGLSAVFSSPDDPGVTLKSWATVAPSDFIATATAELGGTSDTAAYGQPYSATPDATQKLGFIDLQALSGVRIPIDTANDFVLTPLKTLPTPPPALAIWSAATAQEQTKWTTDYATALAAVTNGDPAQVAPGDYGPVPALTGALLTMAGSGNLDGVLQSGGQPYNLNYTPTILFLGDGTYFAGLADAAHLTGDQWGVMNETGNTPGQSWLWLFSLSYQIPPFNSSPNADILVVAVMVGLSLLLTLLPFIPGLRSVPRKIPVYRLIWKDYYRNR